MRCHSLQALWGPSPPQHHVRAVLLVDDPASLWTGATDGVIVLWRLMVQQQRSSNLTRFDQVCFVTF